MSTEVGDVNNVQNTSNKKKSRNKTVGNAQDAMLRTVFRENEDPIDYAIQIQSKVHAINKTFLFPDVVNRVNINDAVKRNKALDKLIDWLGYRSALTSGQYDTKDIVENATKLFQRLKRYGMKHDFEEEEKVLKLLEILSAHAKSAKQMASKNVFIQELYNILYNVQAEHQDQAAKILCNLTNHEKEFIEFYVKSNRPFRQLKKVFDRPVGTLYYPKHLWIHLAHLLEVYPTTGVKFGFFDMCFNRIKEQLPGYHMENMRCFTAMMRSRKGFDAFLQCNAMDIILNLIAKGSPETNYEYILKCLDQALENTELQSKCVPYEDLPLDIVDIAKKSVSPVVQKTCMRIISKLYLVKTFDSLMHEKCLKGLKKMKTSQKTVESQTEMGKVLSILEIASASPKSAALMASKQNFMKQLYKILTLDKVAHQEKAAQILANLTGGNEDFAKSFAKTNDSFAQLKEIFKVRDKKVIPTKLWEHLSNLIKASPQAGLKYGFYDICIKHIQKQAPGFEKGPVLCLTSLLRSKKAWEQFEDTKILPILLKFINDKQNRNCEFKYILQCFNEALQSEKLQEEFVAFPDLPIAIVQIAKKSKSEELQMEAMEIIKKLYTIPPFDFVIHGNCYSRLKNLTLSEELADYEKQQFINILETRHKLYKSK